MPPRSHTKFDVGIVSWPGWSNTIRGLALSPSASQNALPNAFAPSSQPFQSGESHAGGTPQWSKFLRLMEPTAPSCFAYSPFSSVDTTATARPPAFVTSWTASDPSPPEPPHTSTGSPGSTTFGGQPKSIRYAVPPVRVGAAASSQVRRSAFGMHWWSCTLVNCDIEPQHVS